ncbi:MAG TPA: PqqD family peptide modification chaperone [Candidatus Acidoferrales bacterium]|nr:PqqD family peptide modification chaperone [Candidatus Acidoferrales bacterium]
MARGEIICLGERSCPVLRGHTAEMAIGLSLHSIVVASPHQVSCPLGEESAILSLNSAIYYGLNPVGTRIWNLLQKPRSIAELRDALVEEYDVAADRCERDLLELLEEMSAEGLIEASSAAAG